MFGCRLTINKVIIQQNRGNLRVAGVPVDFELYVGCYHAFDRMNPYADVSLKAISFLMKSFKYAVEHYFAEQST